MTWTTVWIILGVLAAIKLAALYRNREEIRACFERDQAAIICF